MIDSIEVNKSGVLQGKKILWVEDDSFLKDIIAQKLSHEQATLFYASEGERALVLAKKEKPDVVMLDILLPGMDGVTILSRLKESPETKDIPVIMFSNLDEKSKIDQSMHLGASGFFVKSSMTLDQIVAKIVETISK